MSDWVWPTDDDHVITGRWQEQRDGWKHEGVDTRARLGKRILAPCAGVISKVNRWDGTLRGFQNYGNYVILIPDTNITQGIYLCHMQSVSVVAGQHVQPGDVIGMAGSTGNSSGAHLHVHISDPLGIPAVLGQRVIDPTPFLTGVNMPVASPFNLFPHIQQGSANQLMLQMAADGKVPELALVGAAVHCDEIKRATRGVTKTVLRDMLLSEQGRFLDEGREGGRKFVREVKSKSGAYWASVDILLFMNEQGGEDAVRLAQINEASLGFVEECVREGKKPYVGGFSVGRPGIGQMHIVAPCIVAALAAGGGYHEHDYGPRDLFNQAEWYVWCWKKHIEELAAVGVIVPPSRILITEMGHDRLDNYQDANGNNTSNPWRKLGISIEQLKTEYLEYARLLWLAGVKGAFLYNWYGAADQVDYELMEINGDNLYDWYREQVRTWMPPTLPPPVVPDYILVKPGWVNGRPAAAIYLRGQANEALPRVGSADRGTRLKVLGVSGNYYQVAVTIPGIEMTAAGVYTAWVPKSLCEPG